MMLFFLLLVAIFRTSAMDGVPVYHVRKEQELAPQPAALGQRVQQHIDGSASRIICSTELTRGGRVMVLPDRAGVYTVKPDGHCGFSAMSAGLQVCLGRTRAAPTPENMRSVVARRATEHVLGASGVEDLTAVLSPDQLGRARSVRIPDVLGAAVEEMTAPEDKTVGWFREKAQLSATTKWIDVTWFSFLASEYGVNIMLWEPSPTYGTVQPYSAALTAGMFLFEKKDKMDEEGDRWVHLLYRKHDDPWAAREGVGEAGHKQHNHFDRLQLGLNVHTSFIDVVRVAKEKALGMAAPVPSASATAGKKAPGSAKVDGEEVDDPEFSMRPSGSNSNNSSSSSRQAEGKAAAGKKSKAKIGSKVGVKRPTERQPGDSKRHKAGGAPGKQRKAVGVPGKRKAGGAPGEGRGAAKKCKSTPTGRRKSVKSNGQVDEANYDSDGSIGGGDHERTQGSFASMSQNEKKVVAAMKKIQELKYRRAYLLSNKRRARGLKVGLCSCRLFSWHFPGE